MWSKISLKNGISKVIIIVDYQEQSFVDIGLTASIIFS